MISKTNRQKIMNLIEMDREDIIETIWLAGISLGLMVLMVYLIFVLVEV